MENVGTRRMVVTGHSQDLASRLILRLIAYYNTFAPGRGVCEWNESSSTTNPFDHCEYVLASSPCTTVPDNVVCYKIPIQGHRDPVCVYHKDHGSPPESEFMYTESYNNEDKTPAELNLRLENWCCLRCKQWGPIRPYCVNCSEDVLGLSVRVGPAGCGLFACKDFPRNTILVPYMGNMKHESDGKVSKVYATGVAEEDELWDAAEHRSLAAFINNEAPPERNEDKEPATKKRRTWDHGTVKQELASNTEIDMLKDLKIVDIVDESVVSVVAKRTDGKPIRLHMDMGLLPLMHEAIWAYSINEIKKDYEILTCYGKSYWSRLPQQLQYSTVSTDGRRQALCCGTLPKVRPVGIPCAGVDVPCYVCAQKMKSIPRKIENLPPHRSTEKKRTEEEERTTRPWMVWKERKNESEERRKNQQWGQISRAYTKQEQKWDVYQKICAKEATQWNKDKMEKQLLLFQADKSEVQNRLVQWGSPALQAAYVGSILYPRAPCSPNNPSPCFACCKPCTADHLFPCCHRLYCCALCELTLEAIGWKTNCPACTSETVQQQIRQWYSTLDNNTEKCATSVAKILGLVQLNDNDVQHDDDDPMDWWSASG